MKGSYSLGKDAEVLVQQGVNNSLWRTQHGKAVLNTIERGLRGFDYGTKTDPVTRQSVAHRGYENFTINTDNFVVLVTDEEHEDAGQIGRVIAHDWRESGNMFVGLPDGSNRSYRDGIDGEITPIDWYFRRDDDNGFLGDLVGTGPKHFLLHATRMGRTIDDLTRDYKTLFDEKMTTFEPKSVEKRIEVREALAHIDELIDIVKRLSSENEKGFARECDIIEAASQIDLSPKTVKVAMKQAMSDCLFYRKGGAGTYAPL